MEGEHIGSTTDLDKRVEIRLPVYYVDPQILNLLDTVIDLDKKCSYYDSINTFYVIFYHKKITPCTSSIYSELIDMTDYDDFYGVLTYCNHIVALKGSPKLPPVCNWWQYETT